MKTLQPLQFKGSEIHFTDSVVELVGSVITLGGAATDMQKIKTANVKYSIRVGVEKPCRVRGRR